MAEFSFTEREEYEKGFAQVYDAKIAAFLREKEVERQAAIKRSKKRIYIVIAITIFLCWQAAKIDPFVVIFPIFIGFVVCLLLFLSRVGKVQREITSTIRPILGNFFEDNVYSEGKPETGFAVDELKLLNIIPDADEHNYGPSITGRWRDTNYSLTKASFYDVRTDSDGDRTRSTLFSGIILEIETVIDMPTIVFYPDFGKTMNKVYRWATRNNRPEHRFDLADVALEEMFEVYTDDLERAKTHLLPSFPPKLVAFSAEYQKSKKYIGAAFKVRKFYMAIDLSHDFMNFSVGNKHLSEADEAIHKALADLMIPRRIIEELLGETR